mgnify:FL=1
MARFRIDRLAPDAAPLEVGGRLLIERCHLARTPIARAAGLLLTSDLGPGEALWIPRCRAVHTLGMRIPIACAFLDGRGVVLRVIDRLDPWRWAFQSGARAVVEALPGSFDALAPGRRVRRGSSPGRRRRAATR